MIFNVRLTMDPTKLEKAILDFVAERNPDPSLRSQIGSLEIASRDHTGVGLYANFSFPTPDIVPRILSPSTPYPGPGFTSPKLEHGAGSVVWCRDGLLSCIEIFSYSDDYPREAFDFTLMPEYE
jgi:hypothetical protein